MLTEGFFEGAMEGIMEGWSLVVGLLDILGMELGCMLTVGATGFPELYNSLGPDDPPENSRL